MTDRLTSPTMVGRKTELTELESRLARAAEGRPSVVVISGEAGVGKTRLLSEFLARARDRGAFVMSGSCVDVGGGGLPFGPIVEALRGGIATLPEEAFSTIVDPVRSDIAKLLPELERDEDGTPSDSATAQTRLFHALLRLWRDLGAIHPVVVAIDDVHWSDRSTRDVLSYMAQILNAERICIVVSFRSEDLPTTHPAVEWLTELLRKRVVGHLKLPRFTKAEVREQVTTILATAPANDLAERLFRGSEGNAFFTEELLSAVVASEGADLPPTLDGLLRGKIERLSPGAQDVLRVASVAGRRIDDGSLAAIGVLDETTLGAGLREAVAGHVLIRNQRDDTYGFRHALLREAVYGQLTSSERRRLHGALAEALARLPTRPGDTTSTRAAEIAYHYDEAGESSRAFSNYVQAGFASMDTYAHGDAFRHLRRAIELWEEDEQVMTATDPRPVDIMRRACAAGVLAGEPAATIPLARRALDLIDRDAERDATIDLLDTLAKALWTSGDAEGARATGEEAIAALPAEASELKARVLTTSGFYFYYSGEFDVLERVWTEALEVAKEAGAHRQRALATTLLGSVHVTQGRIEEGVAELVEGERLSAETAGDVASIYAFNMITDTYMRLGRFEDAVSVGRAGVDIVTRLGLISADGALLRSNLAESLFFLGRWDEGEEVADYLLGIDASGWWEFCAVIVSLTFDIAKGRFDRADRNLARVKAIAESSSDAQVWGGTDWAVAELRRSQGRLDESREAALRHLEGLAETRDFVMILQICIAGLQTEADAAASGNQDADAIRRLVQTVDAIEASAIGPRGRSMIEWCRAEHARASGNDTSGRWRSLADAWRGLLCPYLEAYALLRAGAAHLAEPDRRRARDALERAHHLAAGLGADPLTAQIERLASKGGIALERAPRPSDPLAGLTDRELDVLKLVTAGMSNREIGRELYISVKTASVHVSHILAKLGVSTRVEAAGIAHAVGLVEPAEATQARS